MSAKIELIKQGNFGASIEMFVSLLLTRVREDNNVESMIVAVINKHGEVEVMNSSMEMRDLAYVGVAMQLYVDDRIRKNAHLDDDDDPPPLKDPA